MFTYESTIVDKYVAFAWFSATGRSIWEVALFYQKGLLKREFIRVIGKSLTVAFTNGLEYRLYPGDEYHLYVKPSKTPGYMFIKCPFEYDGYVASWYRVDLSEPITEATWKDLFGKPTPPCELISEDEEYAEFIKKEEERLRDIENAELEDEQDEGDSDDEYPSTEQQDYMDEYEYRSTEYVQPTKHSKKYKEPE